MDLNSSLSSLQNLESIHLGSGIILQADLDIPRSQPGVEREPADKLAICLHPWSWLGGQKDDPVLRISARVLLDKNYVVLRYNSRGVGTSTGWPSLTGSSEAEDLKAVIQWALQQIPSIRTVAIVGYSHGSLVASLHPVLPPPVQTYHVLLSYPYGPRSWLTMFHSSTYSEALENLLRDTTSNVLVVFGDQDEFTSKSNYERWVASLGESKGTLHIAEVPSATHFWRGESARELYNILQERLP